MFRHFRSNFNGARERAVRFVRPIAAPASPMVRLTSFATSGAVTSTSNNTGGNAHNIAQPTFTCNYILRII
jgi:hypothetical protein